MKSIINSFNQQGFAILHGVLASACIEAVKRECEELVDDLAAKLLALGKVFDLLLRGSSEVSRRVMLITNGSSEAIDQSKKFLRRSHEEWRTSTGPNTTSVMAVE